MLFKKLVVIAHNVRSAQNVGSIFRTAECLGVSKMFLTGYTPHPFLEGKDVYIKQGQKFLTKTALGAENLVQWEKVKNAGNLIKKLKKEGFKIIALELDRRAVNIESFEPKFPCVLILGNEVRGIDRKILKKCDKIIHIPMKGKKESLNVSIAAGIVIYKILNK
jgi:23S rRNA (guanosine2251-2'-O)-methyltransferase